MNQISRLILSTELPLQEENIIYSDGFLTAQALREAFPVMKCGEALKNSSVTNKLTKDGSKITDWRKLSTQSIVLLSQQKVQVHFYHNRFTEEINYTHSDFKVKNIIYSFYTTNSPKIITPHSLLNKY
jgi:hypothetical protein